MVNPLVSTIIPVYNRASLVSEAVDSVLAQQYRPIEIIIVDDGSTDDTPKVLKILSEKSLDIIKIYRQQNLGPGPARQIGLQKSSGIYIQYLDSDDLLLPNKFKEQVAAFESNEQAQICYGISYEEDFSFSPSRISGPMRSTGEYHAQLFPLLLLQRWWTTSSPLYRRSLLDKIGPWSSLKNEEDWEYDARAGALRAPLVWVPTSVSIRRINISDDHLSSFGCIDATKLIHRSVAQESIYKSALLAGVQVGSVEMNKFSRASFLLARQSGLAGASSASEKMFHLARDSASFKYKYRLDILFYWLIASVFGWVKAAKIVEFLMRSLGKPSLS